MKLFHLISNPLKGGDGANVLAKSIHKIDDLLLIKCRIFDKDVVELAKKVREREKPVKCFAANLFYYKICFLFASKWLCLSYLSYLVANGATRGASAPFYPSLLQNLTHRCKRLNVF